MCRSNDDENENERNNATHCTVLTAVAAIYLLRYENITWLSFWF